MTVKRKNPSNFETECIVFVSLQLKSGNYVLNFIAVNARILFQKKRESPFEINLLQIYAPTAEKKRHEVEMLCT